MACAAQPGPLRPRAPPSAFAPSPPHRARPPRCKLPHTARAGAVHAAAFRGRKLVSPARLLGAAALDTAPNSRATPPVPSGRTALAVAPAAPLTLATSLAAQRSPLERCAVAAVPCRRALRPASLHLLESPCSEAVVTIAPSLPPGEQSRPAWPSRA
eukprot:scaffold67606_cov67-Phaeocystis_antarctica.AAC.4